MKNRFLCCCQLVFLAVSSVLSAANLSVEVSPWGKLEDGREVQLYTLRNAGGMEARMTNYGAMLVSLKVPDAQGQVVDVVLGKETLAEYLAGHPCFGCTVGRYANRIAWGKFTLDGVEHHITTKSKHAIHGGLQGFDKRLWKASPQQGADAVALVLEYASANGEEGFPGEVKAQVTYRLDEQNQLTVDYGATTDQPTVINLTNHSYFNLAGGGDVLSHELTLHADLYTATDADLIPTGEILPVKNTPLDFTSAHALGQRIKADFPALKYGHGYDHNYLLRGYEKPGLKPCALVRNPSNGLCLEVQTTHPAVQLYTANHMKKVQGKGGQTYGAHAGFCLETQHCPDSPNHPSFPSTVLRPGQQYQQQTVFRFFTQK
jgi:aldose 1-epimerase